jgi:hypothetical protein
MTDTGIIEAHAVASRRYAGPGNVTNNDRFYLYRPRLAGDVDVQGMYMNHVLVGILWYL